MTVTAESLGLLKKKILLIEDDRLVASSIADLLKRCGLHVSIATGRELALKLAQSQSFDLIISDIRMPGELGTEVVKQINSIQPEPKPFIFITGYSDESYIEEAKRMGCNGFFLKPFDVSALIQNLESVLNLKLNPSEPPVVEGLPAPSRMKRLFYSALSSQWNPEKEIDWNGPIKLTEPLSKSLASILSPIIMGEYSAFYGLPQRILSFRDYEVKQYLAVQLVDETRHAEAFDLYLARIKSEKGYKKGLRNIYALRFFNGLKKLQDNDQWVTGLYLTEILAHVLLTSYAEKTNCPLTQHLFKMILSDEGRHISFSNYYLRTVLKDASKDDRKYMVAITDNTLKLTEGMIHSYEEPYKAFGLNPEELFNQIKREVDIRLTQNILKMNESSR